MSRTVACFECSAPTPITKGPRRRRCADCAARRSHAGAPPPVKSFPCPDCGVSVEYGGPGRRGNPPQRCPDCAVTAKKAWRREYARTEKYKVATASFHERSPHYSEHDVLHRMGLSPVQFYMILDRQHGTCALCPATESADGSRLQVDHRHDCCDRKRDLCGECFRSLLCRRCNLRIGRVELGVRPASTEDQAYLTAHKGS